MRSPIMVLVFFLILGLGAPVLAMEKLSKSELKKITAQLASSPSHAGQLSTTAGHISPIVTPLITGYADAVNMQDFVKPVGVGLTPVGPVSRVINIVSDANSFRSAITFGLF